MHIFLNPGHHKIYDSGAVNRKSGLRETDVALRVSARIKNYLEVGGLKVTEYQADDLGDICDRANNSGADYFISIHCNAFNEVARGTEVEVYQMGTKGAKLAQVIQDCIVDNLGTIDRGLKERPGLYVLKHTDMPACLIELEFIDNNEGAKLLVEREDDFARAIADGIMSFTGYTIKYNNKTEYLTDSITGKPVLVETAPNGKHYTKNDVDYLLSKGYTKKDALDFLSTDPKYAR